MNDESQDAKDKNINEKVSTTRVDPIDVIIAKRLYRKRCFLGYSQKDLADYTGISIQQVQKYEKSTNRISGGRLYKFAKFLKVSITYFFDNIEEDLSKKQEDIFSFAEEQADFDMKDSSGSVDEDFSATKEKEVITLVKFFSRIRDHSVRKKFIELAKVVSSAN